MPLSASIFRRGGPKKELFDVINEEGDDENELNAKLAELDELLHTEKAGRELSAAIWRPWLCAAELVKQRKQCAKDMGFTRGRKLYLHVEEAVYLMDRGDLLLFIEEPIIEDEAAEDGAGRQAGSCVGDAAATGPQDLQQQQQQQSQAAEGGSRGRSRQRLLSVQEGFDLMISLGVPLERYLLYSTLSRSGYLVMRHPSRWQLDRQEAPEQIWGHGGWAPCYGRQPTVPGLELPQQRMQQQLAAAAAAAAAAKVASAAATPSAAAAHATSPMEEDAAAGPLEAPGEDRGGDGGHLPPPPPQQQQQQQRQQAGRHHQGSGGGGGGGVSTAGSRGWWLPAGPSHPHLAGVPEAFFEELPPATVEDRPATSLLAKFPGLRPFPKISSAIAANHPLSAAVAAPQQAMPAGTAAGTSLCNGSSTNSGISAASGAGGGSGGGGVALGVPRVAAHLLYDVYKPGSYVSRSKNQYPVVHTHVAMCSATPPSLGEMWAADAAAAAAVMGVVGEQGEGRRPAVVTWAAVFNGDLALYSIGESDLIRLL